MYIILNSGAISETQAPDRLIQILIGLVEGLGYS